MKHLALLGLIAILFASERASAQAAAPSSAAAPSPPASAPATLERKSFLYANRDGSQQLHLDRIIDPSVKVPDKRPVILFSFGGGWEGGSRNDPGLAPLFVPYTSMGYAVIAIDYRLGIKIAKDRNEVTPTNGVQMYLRAIQWSVEDLFDATSLVLKNADQWNIDPKQIVLMGGSAGATNSLVAEYNVANETELARTRLPENFRYAGVISMAGAFWLPPNTPLQFKNKPAPIMFFHGAKDQLVTYDRVQGDFSGYGPAYFFREFAGTDYPKWFVDYPKGDHVIAATPAADSINEIKAFLQKLVKERQKLSIHTIEESDPPKNLEAVLKALTQPAKNSSKSSSSSTSSAQATLSVDTSIESISWTVNAKEVQSVPRNYTETTKTGGEIEAKYLKKGAHGVSYMEQKADAPIRKYAIYYPQDIENIDKPLPVVVFANGSGVRGSRYIALFEHMASWGFIVVGNDEDTAYSGQNANNTLDYLLTLNQDAASVFHNKVDRSNIGITGHSQGGVGVFNAITSSDKYRTAVSLSCVPEDSAAAIGWKYDASKIKIPIMLFAGTDKNESISLDKLNLVYSHIKSPKIMARRVNAIHPEMLYSADGYVTAWFMWQLKGDQNAAKAFIGDSAELMNNKLYQDMKNDLK